MADNTPVIVAAKRTPIGRFLGGLSRIGATDLGGFAVRQVLADVPAVKDQVDEVVFGIVLTAGIGQNPGRQAGLKGGLGNDLIAYAVNKVCGSSLKAVMLAAQSIKAGDCECVIAGGMESMSQAPHYVYVRNGLKFGPGQLADHMANDGLTCPFEHVAMGIHAEYTADKWGVSREDQDRWSAQSHQRAAAAWDNGWYDAEVFGLEAGEIKQKADVTRDEGIRAETTAEGIGKLRPAFTKDGTVTAANASQISDGAAALVVMTQAKADALGLKPLARIVSYHTHGVEPKELFIAPVGAVKGSVEKAGWSLGDVDLFELNEAFASQTVAGIKQLEIPEDKVNICGGGIALGHPIGASGSRVLVTLVHQLQRTGGTKGVVSLCLGGGNAVAMCVERA
ncbi:MAG: thiolase family protein [Planctomycetes bacterium]|nr:thiolase family protein [Planctomycetota bacterium]NOG54237.1 thiolase family protein [Planctomycetota bacterium]